jgi:hypothetical protein
MPDCVIRLNLDTDVAQEEWCHRQYSPFPDRSGDLSGTFLVLEVWAFWTPFEAFQRTALFPFRLAVGGAFDGKS